ncbi:DUF4304 domain-containing protein [Niallia sp. Man26]|uniref:DUF4304 domain-containing protein n=1 Tax=Niallia sp. Man26 TaxID=2912824 RepID=UPI001EDA505E|nr:DUF4304 domain-containing protein [Niallia sp. Man26]UPO87324.1 DUF4304 domain-containing protein [Niallia sp. Man26]
MLSDQRREMLTALKEVVIPVLRRQGFKGSLNHFRRRNKNNIDLITFQFNKWGGSFIVELAVCPKEATTMIWGKEILPNKVTAHHMNNRYRLGSKSIDQEGIWFDYENAVTKEDYQKVAERMLKLLNTADVDWNSSLFK